MCERPAVPIGDDPAGPGDDRDDGAVVVGLQRRLADEIDATPGEQPVGVEIGAPHGGVAACAQALEGGDIVSLEHLR